MHLDQGASKSLDIHEQIGKKLAELFMHLTASTQCVGLTSQEGEVTSIILGNYSTDSWPLLATIAQHMIQSGDDGARGASEARQGELTFLSKLQG